MRLGVYAPIYYFYVFTPSYRRLPGAELAARAHRAVAALAACRACPRDCRVDRLHGKWAACKTGRHAVVSSAFAHFGEEDCLRGWNGSGTIFFTHCNLRCVFCQNFDISQAVRPAAAAGVSPERLAALMLMLQREGCHNINFVTPEHVVPQILEALPLALELGLNLPLVYNTSAYDSLESLVLMDGIVDVYLPDFKYWTREAARRYLKAEDYPSAARAAIREMHRQVGVLQTGADGLARRGVLLRHLVMPSGRADTRAILDWVAEELGPGTCVNLMDQYRPAGKVGEGRYRELDRPVSSAEFREAVEHARELGLRLC
jgi:putative pyruvate formate lyase activating enzyme